VRDVGERAAMDERGVVLERLHQVRRQRLLQQHRHRAVRLQVARENRLLIARVAHDDLAEPLLQIVQAVSQAEDRHDLGSHDDVEAILTRIAVRRAAEADDDVAQRAIVTVDHPPPGNAPHVEAELVALVDVVVDQGGEQVVGQRDGREVAGEVEVDVLHRHDLRVTAAGGAALHAEHRAERRLAQADDRLLADVVQGIAQPTVVVVLPSPAGVGEIAVTSTSLPLGRLSSCRT
jgi:hypothetical protein